MVVAAGGTGGHMFPALAVVEVLRERRWRIEFLTDPRGAAYLQGRLKPGAGRLRSLRLGSPWRGTLVQRGLAPAQFVLASLRLLFRWLRERPVCVAAFGGYATAPALLAAWLLRVPRVVHEQNAALGRVNGFFVRRGAALACGIALPAEAPAPAKTVGVPVRAEVLALANCAYAPPAPGGPLRLLVVGGSQGSRAVARLFAAAAAAMPPTLRARLRVACQVRAEDRGEVERRLADAGVEAELAAFFSDLPRRIADSHLVVSRAGASTISELSAIGRPSVLVPLPTAARDHQAANARAWAASGAALVHREGEGGPEAFAALLTRILADGRALARMAGLARGTLPARAAEAFSDLAEQAALQACRDGAT